MAVGGVFTCMAACFFFKIKFFVKKRQSAEFGGNRRSRFQDVGVVVAFLRVFFLAGGFLGFRRTSAAGAFRQKVLPLEGPGVGLSFL